MKKLLLLLPLLGACTNLTTKTENHSHEYPQWQQHQEKLTELLGWQLESRAFIQAKEEGFSSNIQWQQQDQDYQLRFSAPFSQGIYHLKGKPKIVTLRMPDNSLKSSPDPESLLVDTLGFTLPVSGLKYWLRGLPDPANAKREIRLDQNERLAYLSQSGWQIEIRQYIHKAGYYLPTKLTMKNRHLKLKILIKNWQLGDQLAKPVK